MSLTFAFLSWTGQNQGQFGGQFGGQNNRMMSPMMMGQQQNCQMRNMYNFQGQDNSFYRSENGQSFDVSYFALINFTTARHMYDFYVN